MLHLQNTGFGPKDAVKLLAQARQLCSVKNSILRDARVSNKYIEFDVSILKDDLDQLIGNLKTIGRLDHAKQVVEEEKEKEDAIKEGIFYFNNERFWECHEVLEGVWKNCYEGEKDLVQGIILIAAALVHFQKNEDEICLSIFGRALEKLSRSSGKYHGIDIEKLQSTVKQMLETKKISTFEI